MSGQVIASRSSFRCTGPHFSARRSILSSSRAHPADEVIVIDDGWPNQEQLSQAIAPYEERLTLLRQPNGGAAVARNTGLAAAASDFVAFLDADDRLASPAFSTTSSPSCRRPPTRTSSMPTPPSQATRTAAGRTFMTMCPSRGRVTLESLLAQQCNVLTSTVVVRRSIL